jgi:tetratricopeptide (TPR) repeat protein
VLALVEQWATDTEKQEENSSDRALAEFYRKNFNEACRLYAEAAATKLARVDELKRKTEVLLQKQKELTRDAINDLRKAGDAEYFSYRFDKALEFYDGALDYIDRDADPDLWAAALLDLGLARWQLGIRVEATAARSYLSKAVEAYRAVLKVRTRKEQPQDWP